MILFYFNPVFYFFKADFRVLVKNRDFSGFQFRI